MFSQIIRTTTFNLFNFNYTDQLAVLDIYDFRWLYGTVKMSHYIKNEQLESFLRNTFSDLQLSEIEHIALREIVHQAEPEQVHFLRNLAFTLVREQLTQSASSIMAALKWLERVIKTLDNSVIPHPIYSSAHFSPGNGCRQTIINALNTAIKQVDICVFTIADNTISNAIFNAYQREVEIRIITDDEKSQDDGSDIHWLKQKGIKILTDQSPYFMHHKFAIVDNNRLFNGSFNWTRTASEHNQENLLTTNDPVLLSAYQKQFNQLWQQFSRLSN